MGQMGTRKRPAPGASLLVQPQKQNGRDTAAGGTQTQQDHSGGWKPQDTSGGNTNYPDPSLYSGLQQNGYPQMSQQFQESSTNQLMRRAPNQNVVQQLQNYANTENGSWSIPSVAAQTPTQEGWPVQYDELDQRANMAKRDAQSKRKQIPPFIQKLSSFLDESRNTDLIRWSESGDSFIVIDEDEFAKTLIPELFKHNNYASFVRQLNMYGFHKKVGLSDNSMRASEKKNKNPSEYSNPYFKRGRPNLLWLIQKPKNPTGKGSGKGGRTKQEDFDEEVDETFGRENSPVPPNLDQLDDSSTLRGGRQPLLTMGNMANRLPQDDLSAVHRELQMIRDNQHKINEMLQTTRREHQQLYGQAKAFHDLHEKHDNSINAILTFLATVYNKNLNNGQGGMGNMFPGSIPANEQERGNVVEMGDVKDAGETPTPTQSTFRRQPLLLEDSKRYPTTADATGRHSKPNGLPSSTLNTQFPFPTHEPSLHSPTIQELSDGHTPSSRSSESPTIKPSATPIDSKTPQADIMSMLNTATVANSTYPNTPMDFSEALSHLQNSGGQSPLTPHQRQNMLQLMDNEYKPPNCTVHVATPPNAPAFPPSPTNGLASQAHFDNTTTDLNNIASAIRDQSHSINNLSNTLTPLSPSGSIPGMNDWNMNNPVGDLDFDHIFDNSYFTDAGGGGGGLEDFDFGSVGDYTGGNGSVDGNSDAVRNTAVDGNGEAIPSGDATAAGDFGGSEEEGKGSVVETLGSSAAGTPDFGGENSRGDTERERSPAKRRRRG